MPVQNPVVVIPGITGTSLRDRYAVDPETIWSVLRKDELRAALHPDDLALELLEPARIEADALFKLIYGDLVEELRAELSTPPFGVPVFPFPYDWRLPLTVTVERLAAFVQEVTRRTGLLRHYHRAGYNDAPRVDLVAHSMGGLIAAGYLASAGKAARVGKVVTIATPYEGSLEAPIKVVTGTADIGEVDPNPRDRFAARLTPALYHLLPGFEGAIAADPGIPEDLFEVAAWQPSVLGSIADVIQLHGREPPATKPARLGAAEALLRGMLKQAYAFREEVRGLKLSKAGLAAEDWLCLVGVDERTRVRLPIRAEGSRKIPTFDIRSVDRMNAWGSKHGDRTLTGDGTVPFAAACPSFLPRERLVCIRPKGFGYWELRDRATLATAGFHASLTTMNLVHRLVAAFLLGKKRKGIGGWRPPGVAPAAWKPPIAGLEAFED
jgi:pimeloyl-ACP methyl ester carboxylesterase